MNIIEKEASAVLAEQVVEKGYHVLTFAETGIAMLNIYGDLFGLDWVTISKFSDRVNENNKCDSLHPKADLSAIPRYFIRDQEDSELLTTQIESFLMFNQRTIHAKKILFDFRAGVAPFVITACRQALQSRYANNIDEVIIANSN